MRLTLEEDFEWEADLVAPELDLDLDADLDADDPCLWDVEADLVLDLDLELLLRFFLARFKRIPWRTILAC